MKFFILAALYLSAPITKATSPPPSEADRREGISYSTNVVHGDPQFPDQQAQSSISFNLETPDAEYSKAYSPHTTPKPHYHHYTTQKSVENYPKHFTTHNVPTSYKQYSTQQQQQQQIPFPSHRTKPYSYTKLPKSAPFGQSQSFNVGYSVKFANGQDQQRAKSLKVPRLESDIITGSHKEEVNKPMQFTNPDFDHSVFFEKKPKSIKPQKFNQQPQQFEGQTFQHNLQTAASTWKTLGPSVEIIRSKEVKVRQNNGFDHERALGKSEGFDYTNAVDFGAQQNSASQHQYVQAAPTQQHQFMQQVAGPTFDASYQYQPPKLPIDTSLLRDPILTMNKQPMNADDKQIPIHFDTTLLQEMSKKYAGLYEEINAGIKEQVDDTNNAQHPVANYFDTQPSTYQNNDKHYKNNDNYYQNNDNQPSHYQNNDNQPSHHQNREQQINNLLAEQSKTVAQIHPNHNYETTFQNKNQQQDEIKFAYPQTLPYKSKHPKQPEQSFTKLKQKPKMYMVKENVQEAQHQPPQTQFKVLSKPPNGFMRHEFDKHSKGGRGEIRQPRGNQKRIIRDYSIETDLKPPPMPFKIRLRRMHAKH